VDLEEVKACLTRHAGGFREAYIHGSVARGSQDKHSDVDLVLVRDTALPFFDRIREVMDLVLSLGKVDLLIYTEAERRAILSEPGRYFIKDVFEKGIRVEGSQGGSTSMAAAG
jgi:predicted nucleotidyltransferase